MISDDVLDELLRSLDPAATATLPRSDEHHGARLRAEALRRARSHRAGAPRGRAGSGPGRRPPGGDDLMPVRTPRPRRRRHVAAGVVVVLLALTGSAVAYVLTSSGPANPVQTLCYADPDLGGVGVGAAPDAASGDMAGQRPADRDLGVEACARFWSDGTFATDGRVPPLVACLIDGRGIAVVPGTATTCATLGMEPASRSAPAVAVDELGARLAAAVPPGTCRPIDDTVRAGEDALDELGLDTWSVSVAVAASPDRPCASISIDGTRQAVVVVPIPDPDGGP